MTEERASSTNEFSFILKPAEHGVGVFAVHGIAEGTYLRLFGDDKDDPRSAKLRDKKEVPEIFHPYCADRGDSMWCPGDFGVMPIGWYLNHSSSPNAFHIIMSKINITMPIPTPKGKEKHLSGNIEINKQLTYSIEITI